MDFALRFSQSAVRTAFDNETLKSLFWIRANYYHPVDLPDTYGLCWRDAVIRCLDHIWIRSSQPSKKPSPSSPRSTVPEPPADSKLPPVATSEPMPEDRKTAPKRPEDHGAFDEVCEQAVPSCTEGVCVEVEGLVRSLTILDDMLLDEGHRTPQTPSRPQHDAQPPSRPREEPARGGTGSKVPSYPLF